MEGKMTIPDVAIGPKIQEVFERKNIKLSDFADNLGTVRQNVYRIFKKRDLDTGLLIKVSEVLDHNFFQYYQKQAGDGTQADGASSDQAQQLELARQEIDYLKKIINLMEEKASLLQAMRDKKSSLEDQQNAGKKEDRITHKAITLM
jgi:hypothetical protein